VTEAVAAALDEIREAFPEAAVSVREDGDGGAFVIVEPLDPGAPYLQRETWVGFHITFQYPFADVYPHFVRSDLVRVDGQVLGEATSPGSFDDRPAIQLSRRSNRLNPNSDTAALKLVKVLAWLSSR
jgi:hypothetical protein